MNILGEGLGPTATATRKDRSDSTELTTTPEQQMELLQQQMESFREQMKYLQKELNTLRAYKADSQAAMKDMLLFIQIITDPNLRKEGRYEEVVEKSILPILDGTRKLIDPSNGSEHI